MQFKGAEGTILVRQALSHAHSDLGAEVSDMCNMRELRHQHVHAGTHSFEDETHWRVLQVHVLSNLCCWIWAQILLGSVSPNVRLFQSTGVPDEIAGYHQGASL